MTSAVRNAVAIAIASAALTVAPVSDSGPSTAQAQTCSITPGPTGWVVDRNIGAVSVFGDLRVRFNGYSEHDGIFIDLRAPGFSYQALIEKGQQGRYTICGMEVTVTAIWAYGAVYPDVRVSAF